MNKMRYVPDLVELMAECEANYARLLKLMPEMPAKSCRTFGVSYSRGRHARIRLEVLEQFKYTVTIKLTQQDTDVGWLHSPGILIRIYHDARLAEVVEDEKTRPLKGCYRYPNKKMYQNDEKMQRNRYLGEWLRRCLCYGHSVEEVNFAKVS